MAIQALRMYKPLILQVLLAFLPLLALPGCGSNQSTNNGIRRAENRYNTQDSQRESLPNKPVPESSYQALGITNLNLLGNKEALRAFDIALNLERASRLDRCQRIQVIREGGPEMTKIIIRSTGGCSHRASGKEEILVQRNSDGKIISIRVNSDRENRKDLFLEFETYRQTKHHESLNTTKMDEELLITLSGENEYRYEGSIAVTKITQKMRVQENEDLDNKKTEDNRSDVDQKINKQNRDEQKANDQKRSRRERRLTDRDNETQRTYLDLHFEGVLNIANLDMPLARILKAESSLQVSRSRSSDIIHSVHSKLVASEDIEHRLAQMSCGLPSGVYTLDQDIFLNDRYLNGAHDEGSNSGHHTFITTPISVQASVIRNEITKRSRSPQFCEAGLLTVAQSFDNELNQLEFHRSNMNARREREERYSRTTVSRTTSLLPKTR